MLVLFGRFPYRIGTRRRWQLGVAAAACLALLVGGTGGPAKGVRPPGAPAMLAAYISQMQARVSIQADFTDFDDTHDSAFCESRCDLMRRGTFRVEGTAPISGGPSASAKLPLTWTTNTVHGSFSGNNGVDDFQFALSTSGTSPGAAQVDLTMNGTTVTGAVITVSDVEVQEDWTEVTHTTIGGTPPLQNLFMKFLGLAASAEPNVNAAQLSTGAWPVTGTSPAHLVLHPVSEVPGVVWTVELTLLIADARSDSAPVAVSTAPDGGSTPPVSSLVAANPWSHLAAFVELLPGRDAVLAVLAVVMLVSVIVIIAVRRRRKRRRTRRVTGQAHILVEPGAPTHMIRTSGPTAAVVVLFDPSKATYSWRERT